MSAELIISSAKPEANSAAIFSNISNFLISSSNSCFTLILISHSPIMSECLISFCEKVIETVNIKK